MGLGRISDAARICAIFLAFTIPGAAQTGNEGSVEGIVTDPSGATVPGVSLQARNLETAATLTATTNQDGLFRFPVLPVGTYELVAERAGFATLFQKPLGVTVGARISLTLTLQLAGKSESILVSGATPLLETTRSQTSTTLESRTISSLPVNGRNFLDFVLLTPGVVRGSRGFDASFGGQRKLNLVRVDGADNDNTYFGEALGVSGTGLAPYQFSLATVQEFQVSTNSYSAELGRAGGGIISVVTKSGANDFHGDAFWYYRDKSMNANDVVSKLNSQPKPPFHFNQFGGTLGGPIWKNRLFFFAAYDGQRSKAENLVVLNLPANFTLSANPVVAGFQQQALNYLVPRASSWLRTFDQDVFFAKADWRISIAHLFAARWNRQRFTGDGLENTGQQVSFEHTGQARSDTDTVAASLTSSLSSTLVNVALFSYAHSDEPGATNSINPEANVFEAGQLVLAVGRAPNDPRESTISRGQWSDTLSYSRGRHAWKFGADVLVDRIRFINTVNFSGSYRFNTLESLGRSLAGSPVPVAGEFYRQFFSGQGQPGFTAHPDFWEFAGFVQDEWRVRPRLTLNLGVRYDLQVIAKPAVKNPSPALAAAGLDTSELQTDSNNLAPRLGLAWTPLRHNRLVVRAGYGIFYWHTPSIISSRPEFLNGVTVQTRTLFANTPGAASIPAYPNTLCGAPNPSGLSPTCAPPIPGTNTLVLFSPSYQQPYTQQGSVGVEVQPQKNLAVTVTYLAVKGTHLQRTRDLNLAGPETPTNIGIAGTSTVLTYQKFTLRRPIAGFDRVLALESSASSIYHAVAVQVTKRFSQHFQLLGSYTLSKVIDDNPEPIAVNPGMGDSLMLSDPFNPRADRSTGVNDQRHRFVLSGIWDLDYARGLHGAAKAILGGWEFGGIFTAQTGQPYSGLVSFDLNSDGNPASDRTPALGRNTFYLPANVSLDPRLTRNVQLTERVKFQFIWEAFNIFNQANISDVRRTQFARPLSPAACGVAGMPCLVPQNTGLSAFGVPVATSGARVMQLSAKLVF